VIIYIPDDLDQRMRRYIYLRFRGHVHGKISEVIREALEQYLNQQEETVKDEEI